MGWCTVMMGLILLVIGFGIYFTRDYFSLKSENYPKKISPIAKNAVGGRTSTEKSRKRKYLGEGQMSGKKILFRGETYTNSPKSVPRLAGHLPCGMS